MSARERRRSARHLLGEPAEVHLGPKTVTAQVVDVSQHGMGLILPPDVRAQAGETIWILVGRIANYAITGRVARVAEAGRIGVELEEILEGTARAAIESLPPAE